MIYSTKSQKSSLSSFPINPHFSTLRGLYNPPKTHQYFDELHTKIEPILQFHFESSINFASGAQAWGLEGSILKDVTMQILEE